MRPRVLAVMLACAALGAVDPASAQEMRAIVTEAAPIYLVPDSTRTPLRTVPVGTSLELLGREGDWYRVAFQDPQFGRRVGYVAASRVRLERVESAVPDPATVGPGTAQPPVPPARPPARTGLGVRAYGTYGSMSFAASETFEAVAGSRNSTNFGGGATVTGLWRNLFVDVGLARSKVDGQRVFVDGTTVYELGIPLEVTVTPLDIAAGWRVGQGRVSTFVGGGVTSLLYEETDPFADPDENVSERKTGGLALLGVDVEVFRWVFVGGEIRYRAVNGILGAGGASDAFGEDEIGGFAAALRVSFGR
ncbi:MAG TPA: hypothetical protein VD833_14100 [Vicinamibacterales bacterium]|nr:hypothetical protein [Vicinamibacterales bacterium]